MGELLAQDEARDEPLQRATENVIAVAGELMEQDPAIRSVGVGRDAQGAYEYAVLRTLGSKRSAISGRLSIRQREAAIAPDLPNEWAGTRIKVQQEAHDPKVLATITAGGAALIPEQSRHRPLKCGLRVQNFDHDRRTGLAARHLMTVGSIGCFLQLQDGSVALLSNNHVIAGENAAKCGVDRVLQPSSTAFTTTMHAATLTAFETLVPSPISASVKAGTAHLNIVDAAVASLVDGLAWSQSFLPVRPVGPLSGTDQAVIGDSVYMVGSQSGDTYGTVLSINTVVGPLAYGIGNCWFRRSIVVAGAPGKPFATHGDSGAVIVRASDHKVLGLLYAASPSRAWACPIDEVFIALKSSFA